MADGNPLGNVEQETHLEFNATVNRKNGDQITEEKRLIEIYAGWVVLNDVADHDGNAEVRTVKTFLPIKGTTVRTYADGVENLDRPVPPDLQVAVSAAFSAGIGDDDEENNTSLESASVKLEPQRFAGVAGEVQCLVMTMRFFVLNAVILRVGYNVTVSTRASAALDEIDLAKDSVPR